MFVEFVSLGNPSRRIFDDGAGMHEYLLCTILNCGENSVWMFCGLGNAVKIYAVISCPCTKGSVH
jgi:hypothetical protein